MTADVKLSVVILTHNGVADTMACLESLSAETSPQISVLVVDNASTDGTPEVVESGFPWVRLIRLESNLGFAGGNNVGIRAALASDADFVLLLNNDTVVVEGALTSLIAPVVADPSIAAACPLVCRHDAPTVAWFSRAAWIPRRARFDVLAGIVGDGSEPYETDYAVGAALLLRSAALRQIGPLDERYFLVWEETDWCFRAWRAGLRCVVVPRSVILHKVSRSFPADGGAMYQYYFSRNRLLWVEKNLRGADRLRAYVRCARDVIRSLRSYPRHPTARAQMHGVVDYLRRRFGRSARFDGPAAST